MEDFIKKLLEEVPHDMDGVAKTPATCHLFNINDRAKKLSEEKAQLSIMSWQCFFTYAEEHNKPKRLPRLFYVLG